MISRLFFLRRLGLRTLKDDKVALRLRTFHHAMPELDFAHCLVFTVVDRETGHVAGQIELRVGESDSLFYLGHLGYHVDKAFRGRHYALRACKLCLPLLVQFGMTSLSITTDVDNAPSIRTCEKLGCKYESTVDVPTWCRKRFQISNQKRRYILILA